MREDNGQIILDLSDINEMSSEITSETRERINLTVNEGCEGRFENLWNQAVKQMKESGWDLSGCDKTHTQYIRGMKSFVTHLANDTKITKLKNYKNNDVIEFEKKLKESNYSVDTIKPYQSGVQEFHKGFLESGGTKNKIQDAATIHQKVDLGKRQSGVLDRAWNDREVEEMKQKALRDGRSDVYFGIRLGDEFGIRIQTIGKLTPRQVNKALRDGELRVKEKGGKWRNIPINQPNQRELLESLSGIAKGDGLGANQHIFRDSEQMNIGKRTQGQNSHDKTVKSIQNYIGSVRDKIQDDDRKSINEYLDSKEKRIVEKVDLSFHGLRYRFAQREIDRLMKEGKSFKDACKVVSQELGHEREQITRIYLCQKNANNQIKFK